MEYSIVVNGIGHAFLREFGCSCRRCTSRDHVANTSLSIIGRDGGIRWHALVDCGLGVVTSLCNFFRPDEARLDWLLLTHWHPDHSLELNRLCETLRRSSRRRGRDSGRISTWCRKGTGRWIEKNHSYEWHRHLQPSIDDEMHPPGVLLPAVPLARDDIDITPFTVSHGTADIDPASYRDGYPCSASFVVESGGKRAVLLWDADNSNDWIVTPRTAAEAETVERISGADYLFIDCLSWDVEEVRGYNTGHLSFQTVKTYAAALNPRRTFLIHLGGHMGTGWDWSDAQWEEAARKEWQAKSLPGTVHVPSIGAEFGL